MGNLPFPGIRGGRGLSRRGKIFVAASPEEGLKLCREVEPDSLELLELESSEVVEAESGLLDGVYNRTGISFFNDEE